MQVTSRPGCWKRFGLRLSSTLLLTTLVSAACGTDEPPALAGAGPPTAEGEGPRPDAATEDLEGRLRALEGSSLEDVWSAVHSLRRSPGEAGAAALQASLRRLGGKMTGLPEKSKFAASVLSLLSLPRGEKDLRSEARAALREVAYGSRSTDLVIAGVEAMALLARGGYFEDDVYPDFRRILGKSREADLTVACCLALWSIHNDRSEVAPLFALLDDAAFPVRARAALALAETGHFSDDVVDLLRRLRVESGERGRRARLLLRLSSGPGRESPVPSDERARLLRQIQEMKAELEKRSAENGTTSDHALAALVDLLQKKYVEPARLDRRRLYTEAFRALVESVDGHAQFLGPDELRDRADLLGQYLGLGARFVKPSPDSPLVVTKPFYNGPANHPDIPFEDRLLTGDRVIELDGIPTARISAHEVRRILARKSKGDLVHLKVQRQGASPRTLRVRYGTVEVPTLFHHLFPEGIGYVKLHHFGARTAEELARSLEELEERSRGLAGLILDVRDNPGGILEQAVRVVDYFVGAGETQPIVSERRRDGRPPKDHVPTAEKRVDCPVVVLVNRATASAAEVVAGALQGYGRASVVGEQTFGKGVSQESVEVPAQVSMLVGGSARIVIPTHELIIPPGRRFHRQRDRQGRVDEEGGIRPDIPVEQVEDTFEAWKRAEFQQVQYADALHAYVRRTRDRISRLSIDDRWRPGSYEDFDELFATLRREHRIRLTESELLLALRRVLHGHLEDRDGRERTRDPREDRQLQRALAAVLELAGKDPESNAQYSRWLGDD